MTNRSLISGLSTLIGIPILAGAVGLYTSNAQGSLAPSPFYGNKARVENVNRENYRCSILVRNPDGSVYQSYKEFNSDGKLIREYKKPYPFMRIDKKPVFHSTTPVFSYPDGTIKAYRPLKEGEKLQDVIREGPVDKYVPRNSEQNNSRTNPQIDKDGWMPAED